MIQTKQISNLRCDIVRAAGLSQISQVAYMIYPDTQSYFPEDWLTGLATKHNVSIVMVYVPLNQWDDLLTPWPAPGEPAGSPSFAGKSAEMLQVLQRQVVPQCEETLGLTDEVCRNLIGVSLAGLFTLWQWMQCDMFTSIACLSGSFWYSGFMDWFDNQPIPHKSGKAYFLLGRQEPKAPVKAYRSVGVNTEAIYERFKAAGIVTQFDWVPGAHISNPLPRAERAFDYLY